MKLPLFQFRGGQGLGCAQTQGGLESVAKISALLPAERSLIHRGNKSLDASGNFPEPDSALAGVSH